MSTIVHKIYNLITYGLVGINIVLNFENVKSIILFIGASFLLSLQIRLYILRIKKEKGQNVNEKLELKDFLKNLYLGIKNWISKIL